MKAYIKAISHYLPSKILTNEELLRDFPEWSVEKVASKLGINQRHIASEDETSMDMAVKAAEQLFGNHNIQRNEIDFIILCTQSPDYFLPTTACIIQDRLGIPVSAGAFDFNLGCSGYIYGLSIAKGLVLGGIANNILLLTSETYSKFLHPKDKSNRTIFGDAATATLISTSGFAEILNFSLGTNGAGYENLIVESGGFRNRKPLNKVDFDEKDNPTSADHLFMEGSEIFNFTLEMVPKLVENTLEKNNLESENINSFIFHQANKYLLNFVRKKIKIPEDKFPFFIEDVGNTVSSTVPLVLENEFYKNSLKGNILLAGFGVGYSWGGVIIRINE